MLGGHLTDVPTNMTYSSVVSRDTVRIGFPMSALYNLDVLAGDIHNALLEASTKEKIFFYAQDECKADKEKVVIVFISLYGLKSSSLQFQNCLIGIVGNRIGYKSYLDDTDIWYKPMTDADGFEYYAYILVYVDDILLIMKYQKEAILNVYKVESRFNLSYNLTKSLPGPLQKSIRERIMFIPSN